MKSKRCRNMAETAKAMKPFTGSECIECMRA
jgi:hypothetical protein